MLIGLFDIAHKLRHTHDTMGCNSFRYKQHLRKFAFNQNYLLLLDFRFS